MMKITEDLNKFLNHLKRDEAVKKRLGYFIITAKVECEFRDQFASWLQERKKYANKYAVARECTLQSGNTADIAIFEKKDKTIKNKPNTIVELKSACFFDSVKTKGDKTQLEAFISDLGRDLKRWKRYRKSKKVGILLIQNVGVPQIKNKEDPLYLFIKYFKQYNSPKCVELIQTKILEHSRLSSLVGYLKGEYRFSKKYNIPFQLGIFIIDGWV